MEINTGERRIQNVDAFRQKTAAFIVSLNSSIMAMCREKTVPCIDLYSIFGSPGIPDLLDPKYSIGDNAHLNIDGQIMLAKAFYEGYFKDAEGLGTVVCLGDSHTQGFPIRDTSRNGLPIDLSIDSPHQFPYHLAKLTGSVFINCGISGNTLYGMKNRFESDVLPHFPDHCVIQGGTNDSLIGIYLEESRADMLTIIEKCMENDIVPVVGTVVPLGF
ncbi:MAG: GDSL-type esterase/lipase family protein [Thermoplasmatota archaeon]